MNGDYYFSSVVKPLKRSFATEIQFKYMHYFDLRCSDIDNIQLISEEKLVTF